MTTHEEHLEWLQAKAPGIQRTRLGFIGRNVVLWHPGGSSHADEGQNTEMK